MGWVSVQCGFVRRRNIAAERIELRMEIIAMYLPQFHRTKENDEWWGEGFTEWTAVKNAKPLFPEHGQPRTPLHGNYYDLLDRQTMERQAEEMEEYGIDGMCFYHYYFKDGRKILEKPAENLLNWKDINMPFCFSWANESWVRTWSNINDGNAWMNTVKNPGDSSDGVLIEQNYGGRKEWEKHFYYLLPFFEDERYIRKDGRPVFVIYKAGRISCLSEMVETWSLLAKKEGILPVYFICSNIQSGQEDFIDRVLLHEPQDTLHKYFIGQREQQGKTRVMDYDAVWSKLLAKPVIHEKICRGSFTGYDDTPRRGENGTVIMGATPQKFQSYFFRLLVDAGRRNSDYVFINAWNEWGESMYLEPDAKDGYQYLEAVRMAKDNWLSLQGQDIGIGDVAQQEWKEAVLCLENSLSRSRSYGKVLNSWLSLKEKGKKIADYLKAHGYLNIAVYGLGVLGKHLVRELSGTGVKILYGIDIEGQSKAMTFPVYTPQEHLETVDAVIVSIGYDYAKIRTVLKGKLDCVILSLEDVIENTDSNG